MDTLARLLHSGSEENSADSEHHSSSSMSSMDMGGGSSSTGFCNGGGTVMQNGFQTSFNGGSCIVYLFRNAVLDTQGKYVAGVIATLLMGVAVEGLRGLRGSIRAGEWKWSRDLAGKRLWAIDLLDAALLGVQMVLAYWLMLIVMTYETVLFVTIILGLVLGHLIVMRHERMRHVREILSGKKGIYGIDQEDDGGAAAVVPTAAKTLGIASMTPCCEHTV